MMLPPSSPRLESESFFQKADNISYQTQIRGLSLSHCVVDAADQISILRQFHPRLAPRPRLPVGAGLKSS